MKVWSKIDSFRGDSALFTWIYRIGINLAKNDFASSYAKSSKLTYSLNQDEHDVPQNHSPESILIAEESEEKIMNFINNLDIDTRTAFTLREVKGKTYDEISEVLCCPIGTVRSRIFRASQLILEYIDQESWPHYKLNENLPNLKPGEQTILIKKAIINYFEKSNYID